MIRFFSMLAATLVAGSTVFGYTNVIENGSIQTITNVWDATGTNIVVGDQTSDNLAEVSAGGYVTNLNTVVGNAATSMNNAISITGPNAGWVSTGNMYVGYAGSTNSLAITVGGKLDSASGIIGYASTANSNSMRVSGAESIWNNTSNLVVGLDGSGNSLTVTAGGVVSSYDGYVGYSSGASNNTVNVSGAGSVWNNADNLVVGLGGSGNSLMIEAGGVVSNYDGFVGYQSGASSNTVDVSGAGSRWINTGNLYLGNTGASNNSITVADNGTVSAASLTIYTNNSFNLNADGSLEISGDLDVGQDGFNWADKGSLSVGGTLTGLAELDGNGKTLTFDGGSWDNGTNDLWIGATGADNMLVVSNGGFAATSGDLMVGSTNAASTNNSVVIGTLGTVQASNLVVRGTGSHVDLNAGGTLGIIGDFDVSATSGLNWNGGGQLAVLGKLSGLNGLEDEGQILQLSGTNALWNLSGQTLNIGTTGSLNRLIISAGAVVSNQNAYVGAGSGTNNSVLVTGVASKWINSGALVIGKSSNGNSLTITNGGMLSSVNAYVGREAGADDNSVTVAGAASSWINAGNLYVGDAGSGNSLTIESGGMVSNANAFVGAATNANDNSVTVNGTDARWITDGSLQVGSGGNSGNSVTVTNSGYVAVGGLTVADNNNFNLDKDGTLTVSGNFNAGQTGFKWADGGTLVAQSNLTGIATVRGAEKKLTLDGGRLGLPTETFDWGYAGAGNTLQLINGGQIVSTNGTIGWSQDSTGNIAEISGTNSAWYVKNELSVGVLGGGNNLTIGELGLVTNKSAWVGFGSDSNRVSVSGKNAQWLNSSLNVGAVGTNYSSEMVIVGNITNTVFTTNAYATTENSVTVTNGGFVLADSLIIQVGNDFNLDDGGTLKMSGAFDVSDPLHAGLNWNAGGNLSIGGAFAGMASTNLVVGGSTNAYAYLDGGRILMIDGSDANWLNSGDTNLIIGLSSSGNQLVIANGGRVDNATGFVGYGASSASNTVLVSGAGSVWTNRSNLYVGGNGSGFGNTLTVESNAWVFVGEVSSNDVASSLGGIAVASTNHAEMVVGGGASVVAGQMYVGGTNAALSGTVAVQGDGTITLDGLGILNTNSAFNLESGGKLAMTDDFDASLAGFNWNSGGHLSVGGDLSGITSLYGTNRVLTLDGGTWTNGSGERMVGNTGSSNQLSISHGGYVFNTNATVGATSTAWNNAVVVSGSNSLWNNAGTLQIGAADTNGASVNGGNSVTVAGYGTVIANELVIYTNNLFNLNKDGTLRITGGFNLSDYINSSYTNLNWSSGGNLAIEGALTGMATTNLVVGSSTNTYSYLNGGHTIVLDKGTANWSNGGDTNLIIGFNSSNNGLVITNGGTVDNANGFVGWGTGAQNNSGLVSGNASEWANRGNLYVGSFWNASSNLVNAGAGNSLVVSNGGWVFVGESGSDLSSSYSGGIGVASTNGAELVVGNGSITAEQGLHIGVDADKTGTVTILGSGIATLGSLDIATNSALNLYGTLRMTGDLDGGKDGFNWEDGGKLSVMDSDLSGMVGFGGSNKVLTIDGGTWTNNVADFFVGVNGYNNSLVITNGGRVENVDGYIGYGIPVVESNAVWKGSTLVDYDAGVLTVGNGTNSGGWSFPGSGTGMPISSNNLIVVGGYYVVGSITNTTNASNNKVMVTGQGSAWNNTNNLYIGYAGSGNGLLVNNGGAVSNINGYVGFFANASNNWVAVSGSNSVWHSASNLYVGVYGSNSTLTVANQGSVLVGKDLHVRNDSDLSLASNTTVSVGRDMYISDSTLSGSGVIDFSAPTNTLYVSGTNTEIGSDVVFDAAGFGVVNVSNWTFTVSGNTTNQYRGFENLTITNGTLAGSGSLDAFDSTVMSGGRIAPTGNLVVNGAFAVADNTLLQVVAGVGSLRVADTNSAFNIAGMSAEVAVTNNINPNGFNEAILVADGGLTGSFASTNFIEHFLLYDFALTNDATTVSVVSEAALDGQISSAVSYAGVQGIRAGFNGMQGAVFARTKQLRRNRVATDYAIPQEAYLMSQTNAPSGAYGPGDRNTIFGMHFWAQQFDGTGDYDASGNTAGFSLDNNGTTFGFDRLFGDKLVAGINYTYARSDAQSTQGDSINTETYWLGLYSAWLHENGWYVDALAGVGRSNYDTVRTEAGYQGTGSTRGIDFAGTVDAGRYIKFGDWALAPYTGLHYLYVQSDGYTEHEEYGNALQVDGLDVASLESAFGVKLRNRFDTRFGRFQTLGYVEWLYDFINDDLSTSLSDGTATVQTAGVKPDANLFNAGIGLGWICTDYMEIGIGYDERFNSKYQEHMGSVMLDIRF